MPTCNPNNTQRVPRQAALPDCTMLVGSIEAAVQLQGRANRYVLPCSTVHQGTGVCAEVPTRVCNVLRAPGWLVRILVQPHQPQEARGRAAWKQHPVSAPTMGFVARPAAGMQPSCRTQIPVQATRIFVCAIERPYIFFLL